MEGGRIEIVPGQIPLEKLLLSLARHAYELSQVESLAGLKNKNHAQKAEDVNWERYVFPDRKHPLPCIDMDYVNGRALKTLAFRYPDEHIDLWAGTFGVDSKEILEWVKSELEEKAEALTK